LQRTYQNAAGSPSINVEVLLMWAHRPVRKNRGRSAIPVSDFCPYDHTSGINFWYSFSCNFLSLSSFFFPRPRTRVEISSFQFTRRRKSVSILGSTFCYRRKTHLIWPFGSTNNRFIPCWISAAGWPKDL
jgi:hypothetical protein